MACEGHGERAQRKTVGVLGSAEEQEEAWKVHES